MDLDVYSSITLIQQAMHEVVDSMIKFHGKNDDNFAAQIYQGKLKHLTANRNVFFHKFKPTNHHVVGAYFGTSLSKYITRPFTIELWIVKNQ